MSHERVSRIGMLSVGIAAYGLGLLTMWFLGLASEDEGKVLQQTGSSTNIAFKMLSAAEEIPEMEDGLADSVTETKQRDPRERIPWAEWTKLAEKAPTLEQLKQFVEARHRSAESLVAAASFGNDGAAFLKEAMEKFPDSAIVQITALTSDSGPTTEERILWAERLKVSMPDNAVASILAANAKIGAGDLNGSLEELRVVSQQRKFDDLQSTLALGRTDALLHAGFPYVEARFMSGPENGRLTALVHETASALKNDLVSTPTGDARNDAIALGLALGNRLSEGDGSGDPAVELAGMTIENMFLSTMQPDERPAFLEMSVAEARASVLEQRKALLSDIDNSYGMDTAVSEHELLQFIDRAEKQGPPAALQWMKQTRSDENASAQ